VWLRCWYLLHEMMMNSNQSQEIVTVSVAIKFSGSVPLHHTDYSLGSMKPSDCVLPSYAIL
jgi:hypothetical protein